MMCLLSGCTTTVYNPSVPEKPSPHESIASNDFNELAALEKDKTTKQHGNNKSSERIGMIKATAERLGYLQGFNSQMKIERAKVLKNEKYWDQLLDYKSVAKLGNYEAEKAMYVIGGILDQIDSSSETINSKLVIAKDGSYFLREQPYLAQTPPFWLDKLFYDDVKDINLPPNSARYANSAEKAAWYESLDHGFVVGREQAIDEMSYRWNSMLRELIGMTRYWRYVELNKIKDVSVTLINKAINTSRNDKGQVQLDINTRYIKVDSAADFNLDTQQWDFVETGALMDGDMQKNANDDVINGDILLEDLTEQKKVLTTPKFRNSNEILNGES